MSDSCGKNSSGVPVKEEDCYSKKKNHNGGVRCAVSEGQKNQQESSKTIKYNQDNHQKMHNTNHDKQQQKNNPGDHMGMELSIEK